MNARSRLQVESFHDAATQTFSHLVMDRETREVALIDTVLDYEPASGRTSTAQAQRLVDRVAALQARVAWILETHVHADHLSASAWLQERVGGRIGIGARITEVQQTFGALFNAGPDFDRQGRAFDELFDEGKQVALGGLTITAWLTPGHTPACTTYLVRDPAMDASADAHTGLAAFVGDTLFMPDFGTARCDFPGGDARSLYRSINRLLSLPPATPLYLCHDYPPDGRAPEALVTVQAQREGNVHVRDGISEEAFVALRQARDAGLDMPRLILPAVQINMRAGRFPPPESNGLRYLKIPLNAL